MNGRIGAGCHRVLGWYDTARTVSQRERQRERCVSPPPLSQELIVQLSLALGTSTLPTPHTRCSGSSGSSGVSWRELTHCTTNVCVALAIS